MEKMIEFALENRLRELNESLHKRFKDMVFSMQYVLYRYKSIFPTFTDHSMIHSLDVIEFCNKIIGSQIKQLDADEIYVILVSCYLHDVGMGISKSDFNSFSKVIDFGDYFTNHDEKDIPRIIRDFHNEYSGLFINKYSDFLEIPTEEHLKAIIQLCRGHRKVDLLDENEYPVNFKLRNGNTICLPYLAALIRLADEVDITKSRNCPDEYDYSRYTNQKDIEAFKKHEAVKSLIVKENEFIVKVETYDNIVIKSIEEMVDKMENTLQYCRKVVNGRTKFEIRQERIVLEVNK